MAKFSFEKPDVIPMTVDKPLEDFSKDEFKNLVLSVESGLSPQDSDIHPETSHPVDTYSIECAFEDKTYTVQVQIEYDEKGDRCLSRANIEYSNDNETIRGEINYYVHEDEHYDRDHYGLSHDIIEFKTDENGDTVELRHHDSFSYSGYGEYEQNDATKEIHYHDGEITESKYIEDSSANYDVDSSDDIARKEISEQYKDGNLVSIETVTTRYDGEAYAYHREKEVKYVSTQIDSFVDGKISKSEYTKEDSDGNTTYVSETIYDENGRILEYTSTDLKTGEEREEHRTYSEDGTTCERKIHSVDENGVETEETRVQDVDDAPYGWGDFYGREPDLTDNFHDKIDTKSEDDGEQNLDTEIDTDTPDIPDIDDDYDDSQNDY